MKICDHLDDQQIAGAIPASLDRAALPDAVATIDPSGILNGMRQHVFENWERSVRLPVTDLPVLTKPCHRISPSDEHLLLKRWVSSGLGSPLPTSTLPVDPLICFPLVSGSFCVEHAFDIGRLIQDRRPRNDAEFPVWLG